MRDQFNLAEAGFINSPAIEEWPKTVDIVGVTCSPVDGFRIAFDRAIPDAWKWPSNPAVPSDNFQYTVWFFLNIRNQWLGAGFVQMWQGRMEQGGHPIPPIFAVPPGDSVPGWKNLWGDPARWPILSDHVPAPGEQIGIMVTAGNARLTGGVTSVAERSQVVLLTLRSDDMLNVVYGPDEGEPPVVTPPADPPPPVDPHVFDIPFALVQIRDDISELHADAESWTMPISSHLEAMRLEVLTAIKGIPSGGSSGPAPIYEGQVSIPFFGTVKITMTPRK